MLGQNNDRAVSGFTSQFEPDGENYVYRKRLKGPPIPVSVAERDRFVQNFARGNKRLIWISAGLGFLIIVMVSIFAPPAQTNIYIGACVVVIVCFIFAGMRQLFDAPDRELRGRAAVGDARSSQEKMRVFLVKTPYSQFAAILAGLLLVIWRAVDWKNWSTGTNIYWVIGGVLATAAIGYRMFQKWNYEKMQNR